MARFSNFLLVSFYNTIKYLSINDGVPLILYKERDIFWQYSIANKDGKFWINSPHSVSRSVHFDSRCLPSKPLHQYLSSFLCFFVTSFISSFLASSKQSQSQPSSPFTKRNSYKDYHIYIYEYTSGNNMLPWDYFANSFTKFIFL